jgi:eukaryotic-like serine/threonine-protein kinase
VYGVGVVLYELLTGRRAFDGRSLENIRQAVLEADVIPVHQLNRDVSAGLSEIVARAMARDPARRFRSARQLARALRNWLEEEAGQRGAAPLGRKQWAWTAFGGLGLAAAATFWIVGTGLNDPRPSAASREAPPAVAVAAPGAATANEATGVAPAALPASTSALSPVVAAAATGAAAPQKTAKTGRTGKTDAAETARNRERRPAPEAAAIPVAKPIAVAAPAPTKGIVQLAISPWGQVEIDGVAAGTTPPLSRLTLPTGKHQIVVRNEDFPPFTTTVTVDDDKPVTLRHRFGS